MISVILFLRETFLSTLDELKQSTNDINERMFLKRIQDMP